MAHRPFTLDLSPGILTNITEKINKIIKDTPSKKDDIMLYSSNDKHTWRQVVSSLRKERLQELYESLSAEPGGPAYPAGLTQTSSPREWARHIAKHTIEARDLSDKIWEVMGIHGHFSYVRTPIVLAHMLESLPTRAIIKIWSEALGIIIPETKSETDREQKETPTKGTPFGGGSGSTKVKKRLYQSPYELSDSEEEVLGHSSPSKRHKSKRDDFHISKFFMKENPFKTILKEGGANPTDLYNIIESFENMLSTYNINSDDDKIHYLTQVVNGGFRQELRQFIQSNPHKGRIYESGRN